MRSPAQRARRLVRWYPRRWRARYSEEFMQLLIDDMAERPRSLHPTTNVLRSGLAARLRGGALAGDELVGARQIRSGLAWLGAACAAFLAFGVAEWAQISVGWQWTAPSDRATTAASQTRTPAAVVTRPPNRNAVWRSEDSRSNGSSAETASRGMMTSYQRRAALAAV
jgi:hypothetical protein